jgi:NYN domain
MLEEVAVLIDAENVASFRRVFPLLEQSVGVKRFAIRRAFARCRTLPDKLKREAFDLSVDLFEAGFGPHAAEVTLANHATALTDYLPEITKFALVSGDGGLVPLVKRLREGGKKVIVVGHEGSTSRALKESADLFLPIPHPSSGLSEVKNGFSQPSRVAPTARAGIPPSVVDLEEGAGDVIVCNLIRGADGYEPLSLATKSSQAIEVNNGFASDQKAMCRAGEEAL